MMTIVSKIQLSVFFEKKKELNYTIPFGLTSSYWYIKIYLNQLYSIFYLDMHKSMYPTHRNFLVLSIINLLAFST